MNQSARRHHSIAFLLSNWKGEFLLVKYPQGWSLPMRTVRSRERGDHSPELSLLIDEQIGYEIKANIERLENKGDYHVAPDGVVHFYTGWTYRIDTPPPVDSCGIIECQWMSPKDIRQLELDTRVREIFADVLSGRTRTIQHDSAATTRNVPGFNPELVELLNDRL